MTTKSQARGLCFKCDRPLLPQDDVDSTRYMEMGCLQCQVSIAAEHKYDMGKDVTPWQMVHGITPVAAPTLAITEADSLTILNRLSDLGVAQLTEELLLAKRLIQHFHINDFGYLLTELDNRQRNLKVPACLHPKTKPYNIGFDDATCCADCGVPL